MMARLCGFDHPVDAAAAAGSSQRIAAAGRAAFTNYLGSEPDRDHDLLRLGPRPATARLSRHRSLAVRRRLLWVVMLLWSKPWLDRFNYGPFEWLWRSLARCAAAADAPAAGTGMSDAATGGRAHRHAGHRPRRRGDGHIGDEHRRLRHAGGRLSEPDGLWHAGPGRSCLLGVQLHPDRRQDARPLLLPVRRLAAARRRAGGGERAQSGGRPLQPHGLAARLRPHPFLPDLVGRHPLALRAGRHDRLPVPALQRRASCCTSAPS